MKKLLPGLIFATLLQGGCLFAQKPTTLSIDEINGSWHKSFPMPVSLRVITHNEEVMIMRIDSITKTCFYGNQGRDSIALADIATVNIRGKRAVIKYSALALCGLAVFQSVPGFTYGLYRNDAYFTYVGLALITSFASLGTLLYFHPKTRFHTDKYKFLTH